MDNDIVYDLVEQFVKEYYPSGVYTMYADYRDELSSDQIEDILNYIYEKKIPFDQCLIASAEEANYANILSNYRDLLKAPITLGVGKLISSTNPGKVFALLDDWKNSNYPDGERWKYNEYDRAKIQE